MDRKTSRGAILALVLLATFKRARGKLVVKCSDLSEHFADLIDANLVDLRDFSISSRNEAMDDVRHWFDSLHFRGYIRNPNFIARDERGYESCFKVVARELLNNPEAKYEIEAISRFFGGLLDEKDDIQVGDYLVAYTKTDALREVAQYMHRKACDETKSRDFKKSPPSGWRWRILAGVLVWFVPTLVGLVWGSARYPTREGLFFWQVGWPLITASVLFLFLYLYFSFVFCPRQDLREGGGE